MDLLAVNLVREQKSASKEGSPRIAEENHEGKGKIKGLLRVTTPATSVIPTPATPRVGSSDLG